MISPGRDFWEGLLAEDVKAEFYGSLGKANLDHAWENMEALLRDAGLPGVEFERAEKDTQGSYWTFVFPGVPKFEVEMPGVLLRRARERSRGEWPMWIGFMSGGEHFNFTWKEATTFLARADIAKEIRLAWASDNHEP